MIILITGASRGIGLAIAEQFASDKQGHTLILVAKNIDPLKAVAIDLQARFPRADIIHYACDLSNQEQVAALGEWAHNKIASIEVLINNAGYFMPGAVHSEPPGILEQMLSVNLLSAYYTTRAFIQPMIGRRQGHVFNICSIASVQAYDNGGSYSISKFAMLGFGKNLREELKPFNIRVTNVLPGAVYTDSWAGSGVSKERLMEANDVAKLIYTTAHLSPQACVEDIVLRPTAGDL
jgi:short-subunit dehydrogenase